MRRLKRPMRRRIRLDKKIAKPLHKFRVSSEGNFYVLEANKIFIDPEFHDLYLIIEHNIGEPIQVAIFKVWTSCVLIPGEEIAPPTE